LSEYEEEEESENEKISVEITHLLNLPQAEAAKILGIAPSTLSKRFAAATPGRKWPYRAIIKLDKQLEYFASLEPSEMLQNELAKLQDERNQLLAPISIKLV
jgi:hypothetical protein